MSEYDSTCYQISYSEGCVQVVYLMCWIETVRCVGVASAVTGVLQAMCCPLVPLWLHYSTHRIPAAVVSLLSRTPLVVSKRFL
jgi:hypothetical protein